MEDFKVLFHSGIVYSTVSVIFIMICIWGCIVLDKINKNIKMICDTLSSIKRLQVHSKFQIHEEAGAIYQEIKNINRLTMKASDEKNKKL